MSFWEILLLGVALSMDCFAVSLSKGICARRLYPSRALLMAVLFGLFQAGMPLIGYYAGNYFIAYISRVIPWVALILLGFIGGKMIYEFVKKVNSDEDEDENAKVGDYSLSTILVLAVATSIDALATGVVFVGHPECLFLAVWVIGLCSLVFSLLGTFAGTTVGRAFSFPAELVGGLILVGIGLKIWVTGMFL